MYGKYLHLSVTFVLLLSYITVHSLLAGLQLECINSSTPDAQYLDFLGEQKLTPMFYDYRIERDTNVVDTDAYYVINCPLKYSGTVVEYRLSCNVTECVLFKFPPVTFYDSPVPALAELSKNCKHAPGLNMSTQFYSQIVTMRMDHNDISILPENYFGSLSYLNRLCLSDNSFENTADLGFHKKCQSSTNTSVTYLDLSLNSFSKITDNAFCNFRNLIELILSDNSITTIDPDAFKQLTSLQVLDLSYNSLHTLPLDVFHYQRNLLILDMSDNPELHDSVYASLKPLHALKGLIVKGSKILSKETEYIVDIQSLAGLYLEENKITLKGDCNFSFVNHLQFLDVAKNRIETISQNIFRPLIHLTKLNLNGNQISSLSNDTFANNGKLEELYVSANKLSNFPNLGVLEHMAMLVYSFNQINSITLSDHNSLCNMPNLKVLDLSFNHVTHISSGAFDCNAMLRELNLRENRLKEITGVFSNSKIHSLNLRDNSLHSFSYTDISTSISELDISCNEISHFFSQFADKSRRMNLRKLNVSFNRLTALVNLSFPSSDDFLELDFSHNKICNVSFSEPVKHTNLIQVQLQQNSLDMFCSLLFYSKNDSLVTFSTGKNPNCACEYEYAVLQLPGIELPYTLPTDPSCPEPLLQVSENTSSINSGNLIRNLALFSCSKKKLQTSLCQCNMFANYNNICGLPCPNNCTCFLSNDFSTQLINCSGNQLKAIPESLTPSLAIVLAFSFNMLESLKNNTFVSYTNVIELYLDHNHIASIEEATFSPLLYLKILHLQNNLLTQLPDRIFGANQNLIQMNLSLNDLCFLEDDTFDALKRLTYLSLSNNSLIDFPVWRFATLAKPNAVLTLSLQNNPWSCNCSYLEKFRSFLQHPGINVQDSQKIYCSLPSNSNPGNAALISLNSDYCRESNYVSFLTSNISWISVLVSLLVISLLCLILFVYREELKVVVYSRFGLRLFHKNVETSSAEMVYDAFIAHSSGDEEFVMTELVPGLEGIEHPYRLCVHQRDFLAGAIITESIMEAVERSHRTIVVMSDNFVNSEWCCFEFETAHLKTLTDRCNRLIVIVVDKIPKHLNQKMSMYMKTNTYLKWGEKFFWQKLYFALPDKHKK